MAIVLKSNKDTESTTTRALGAPTYFNIITHKTSNSAHAEVVAGNILQNLAMVSYQTEQHFTLDESQNKSRKKLQSWERKNHLSLSIWDLQNLILPLSLK